MLALVSCTAFGAEKQESSRSKTNLSLIQHLVGTIAKQVIDRIPITKTDSISVRFDRTDEEWIAQDTFLGALSTRSGRVYSNASGEERANILVEVSGLDMKVRYDDMFRDGFMGTKKVRRTVGTSLSCRITSPRTAEVLLSHSFNEHYADTVFVDDVGALELSSVKATHAELPSEMFLDRILEPFVIIGATGVAVYLFFHIRS